MLSPMEKVSVANNTFKKPSWKRISIISFKIGSNPEWWIPIPRRRSGKMCLICGSSLSSSDRMLIALLKILVSISRSSSVLKSSLDIFIAKFSQSRLLNEKTITGLYFLIQIILTIL
ncbi:hypothetical protein OGAPHI_001759 [Ogataea philodendri]|uniref:Uncharacterized protein n=1 Tax=Ogataea philodendri TaxID=1378263 RepID=A0A9P8PAI8_9ASCO|nr:uncharacterized protein OGAPHI_001759 [Ogataea philodendri]KAH3668005.1 hypothetical protein OGAPHI_001759 [Ogataea philodendri]